MGDSKVNPDVLLLLISRADEWEGKITGASLGGPVCRPCHPGASQPPSAYLHAPSAGEGALRWDPLPQTTPTNTHALQRRHSNESGSWPCAVRHLRVTAWLWPSEAGVTSLGKLSSPM